MKQVLRMETDGDKTSKTILEATDAFIRDAEARKLRAPSVYKYPRGGQINDSLRPHC